MYDQWEIGKFVLHRTYRNTYKLENNSNNNHNSQNTDESFCKCQRAREEVTIYHSVFELRENTHKHTKNFQMNEYYFRIDLHSFWDFC